MAASVYTTLISRVDEYGFKRPQGFDIVAYDKFMSEYVAILVRRAKRWEQLLGKKQDFSKLKKGAKLQRFVQKGIPMSLRGSVWMQISGAQAARNQDPGLYDKLLTKRVQPKDTTIEQIATDIPRTFPTNIFFRGKDPKSLEQPLFNVLLAFANHNSKIGYCQGLNYVAGLLLLVTRDEDKSFWLMKTLIEDILPDFYSPNLPGLLTEIKVFTHLLKRICPKVQKHMEKHEIPWELICSKWFICLFCDILPIETVFRIWDNLLYNGSLIIMKSALYTILVHQHDILKTNDFAELVTNYKSFTASKLVMNCHLFVEEVSSTEFIDLTETELSSIRQEFHAETLKELDERQK